MQEHGIGNAFRIAGAALALLLASSMMTNAQAEVVRSPARAVEVLVQARVMAERCGWLDTAAREDLATFMARAELAAVRREGTKAAKEAVRRGRAAGRKAACDNDGREMVLAVLEGAREAMRMAAGENPAAPAVAGSDGPESPALTATAAARSSKPRHERLMRYRRMAADYYHELKCRRLPRNALMRLWRKVRDEHMALLRKGAGEALAAAKRAAEREGRQRSC